MIIRCLIVVFYLMVHTQAIQAQDLYSFQSSEGKTGMKDKNGKVVIPALYDVVMKPSYGYVVVQLNKKYGAYDLSGKLVMPLIYEGLSTTSDRNKFFAKQNGKYNFVDTQGNLIKYNNNTQSTSPTTTAKPTTTETGVVHKQTNQTSQTKVPPQTSSSNTGFNVTGSKHAPTVSTLNGQQEYDQAVELYGKNKLTEGFAVLLKAAEKGHVQAQHNLGLFYASGKGVKANLHEARKWLELSAKTGYYKSIVSLWGIDKATYGFLLLASFRMEEIEGADGKYGFVDPDYGDIIIPAKYEMGGIFSRDEQLAPAKLNGKWGFINYADKAVIPFQYEEANLISFNDGRAAVKLKGKWGFINTKNEVVIPFVYDEIEVGAFVNGYAKVKKNGKEMFIDTLGKEYIQ